MFSNIQLAARTVYFIWAWLSALGFSLFATLSAVYRVEDAGLNPLELILIGTVLELTVFIFEVPTGIVADVVSRRLSVIIGTVLIGLGFMLEGAVAIFAVMLVAQVIWGLGATFESGAVEAWISDEIGASEANQAFLRAAQLRQLASLAGIGLAMLLGLVSFGLPMIVGGLIYLVLAAVLIITMPERGFQRQSAAHYNPLLMIRHTFIAGVEVTRRKPILQIMFAITIFLGASSETFDRLGEAHLIQDVGMPTVLPLALWFGSIQVVVVVLSIGVTELVKRFVDTQAHIAVARALFVLTVMLTLALIVFGLAGSFYLAIALYVAIKMLRIVNLPLFKAWLNQQLESRSRATVFSMHGQMDALGQITGGPLLGLLARSAGMPLALVVTGILLLPAALLYRLTLQSDPEGRD